MKLLSVAIPCYNSEAYMEHCIRSLLTGGDEVEILIVDDGSTKDNTAEIADRYEKEYPGICKAIHQENGGHGAAVNAGLKAATGIYFKVVDSDDWVNEQAYRQVLDTLRRFVYGKDTLDMLITNFVYEKQGARHKKVMSYKLALPKDELFSWNDVKVFVAGQYILMHSVIYRTERITAGTRITDGEQDLCCRTTVCPRLHRPTSSSPHRNCRDLSFRTAHFRTTHCPTARTAHCRTIHCRVSRITQVRLPRLRGIRFPVTRITAAARTHLRTQWLNW